MCRFLKLLYWLVPLKSFQSFLINKHFSSCSRCQKGIEIDNQLKEILATPDWVKQEESLWPQIKPKLYASGKEEFKTGRKYEFYYLKKWEWVAVGFVFAVVIGLSFLIQQNLITRTSEEAALGKENPRILIKHAEIKGKKARPYIYQTPDISYIWFSETKNSGG